MKNSDMQRSFDIYTPVLIQSTVTVASRIIWLTIVINLYFMFSVLFLGDVTRDVGDTWHYTWLTLKRTFRVFFFIFCLPYLCPLRTVSLVRMEVMWVCFDVLFFISEFHFLFLLIFILFWLACIYLCCCCFPLGVYFNVCLFAYLFRLQFVFPFCIYLLFMLCDCTLSFFLWKYILL